MKKEKQIRFIIGAKDTGVAGLPISAPLEVKDPVVHQSGDMRWVRKNESFVLERMTGKSWSEVPVVVFP